MKMNLILKTDCYRSFETTGHPPPLFLLMIQRKKIWLDRSDMLE